MGTFPLGKNRFSSNLVHPYHKLDIYFPRVGFDFSPPHTQQHNGTRLMEEPNLIASESMTFVIQEERVGVGKAGLKVRLASDMDKDFLERLNKFCVSTKNPSYSDQRSR